MGRSQQILCSRTVHVRRGCYYANLFMAGGLPNRFTWQPLSPNPYFGQICFMGRSQQISMWQNCSCEGGRGEGARTQICSWQVGCQTDLLGNNFLPTHMSDRFASWGAPSKYLCSRTVHARGGESANRSVSWNTPSNSPCSILFMRGRE